MTTKVDLNRVLRQEPLHCRNWKRTFSILTVNSEGDQQQVIDDTQRQPGEIQEKLKLAKESVKSMLDKFNSRKKQLRKTSVKIKLLAIV